MKNSRHIGRSAADEDKMFDFSRPDLRPAPAQRADSGHPFHSASLVKITGELGDDTFEFTDFRARWWPAPDASR